MVDLLLWVNFLEHHLNLQVYELSFEGCSFSLFLFSIFCFKKLVYSCGTTQA